MMFSQEEMSMLSYNNVPRPPVVALVDRQWKPDVEMAPDCPRCHSSNTKFCYYNNYSLSQPRYFCKGCRRYWTKGGSLRNVPVGGGCRKSRRGKSFRASGDQSSDLAGRHRLSAAGPIRPDLALEDMVSNSCKIQDADSPAAAAGSTIDMAAMYAKYLNQCPEPQPPEALVPELAGELHDQSKLNGDCQRLAQIGEEEIRANANYQADAVEGLEQFMDPNVNYDLDSIAIPMDYSFFNSDSLINIPHLMSEEMVFREFGPLASLHQPQIQLDSEWTKLGYPSTEGFYGS